MTITPALIQEFRELVFMPLPEKSALKHKMYALGAGLVGKPISEGDGSGFSRLCEVVVTTANREDHRAINAIFEEALGKAPENAKACLKLLGGVWKGLENNRQIVFPDGTEVVLYVNEGSPLREIESASSSIPFKDLGVGIDPEIALSVLDYCRFSLQGVEIFSKGNPTLCQVFSDKSGIEGLYKHLGQVEGFKTWEQVIIFLDWLAEDSFILLPEMYGLVFDFTGIGADDLVQIIQCFSKYRCLREVVFIAAQAALLKLRQEDEELNKRLDRDESLKKLLFPPLDFDEIEKIQEEETESDEEVVEDPLLGLAPGVVFAYLLTTSESDISLSETRLVHLPQIAEIPPLIAERIFMQTAGSDFDLIDTPLFKKIPSSFYDSHLREIRSEGGPSEYRNMMFTVSAAAYNKENATVFPYLQNQDYLDAMGCFHITQSAVLGGNAKVVEAVMKIPDFTKDRTGLFSLNGGPAHNLIDTVAFGHLLQECGVRNHSEAFAHMMNYPKLSQIYYGRFKTILIVAAEKGFIEVFRLLLSSPVMRTWADKAQFYWGFDYLLSSAVENNHPGILRELFNAEYWSTDQKLERRLRGAEGEVAAVLTEELARRNEGRPEKRRRIN